MDLISKSRIGDTIRKQLKTRNVKRYAPIDVKTREFLVDFYKPYNKRLQDFTGRDLTEWMTTRIGNS